MRFRVLTGRGLSQSGSFVGRQLLETVPATKAVADVPVEVIDLPRWKLDYSKPELRTLVEGLHSRYPEDRELAASELKKKVLESITRPNEKNIHALGLLFFHGCRETRQVLSELGISRGIARIGEMLYSPLGMILKVLMAPAFPIAALAVIPHPPLLTPMPVFETISILLVGVATSVLSIIAVFVPDQFYLEFIKSKIAVNIQEKKDKEKRNESPQL